jgi:hypothetical protein
MTKNLSARVLRRNNRLYIVQAATEYHICLLVTGSFLAALTSALGMSDALTGVLSSVISLGCVFQLVSLLLRPRAAKGFVAVCSVLNQLLFAGLYLIPFLPLGTRGRIAVFVVGILAAYFIYNMAHPQKVGWLMGWVEDGTRGIFTANMQIISLLSGMAFSLAMGAVCDHFRAKAQQNTAFLVCAAVILVWMVAHTLLLRGVTDRRLTYETCGGMLRRFGAVLQQKKVRRITILYMLWHAANYAAIPFYGTYQIKELGFSLTLVSALSVLGCFVRALVSRAWGNYGDRRSFSVMVRLGFLLAAGGFAVCAFAAPGRALVPFAVFNVLYGVSQGAIEIARTNLIFDVVPEAQRSDAVALTQSLCGLAGFAATALCSVAVGVVQRNGSVFCGLPVYAQQLMSVLAAVLALAAAGYVHVALIRKK